MRMRMSVAGWWCSEGLVRNDGQVLSYYRTYTVVELLQEQVTHGVYIISPKSDDGYCITKQSVSHLLFSSLHQIIRQ